MSSYKLQRGESSLAVLEGISHSVDDAFFNESGTLVLTDRRLVWFHTSAFGRVKSHRDVPLSSISISYGKADVRLTRADGGGYLLCVFSAGRKLSFSLGEEEVRAAVAFANELNHAVTRTDADLYRMKQTNIIQDGVNALKGAFGAAPEPFEEADAPGDSHDSVPAAPFPILGTRREVPAAPKHVMARCTGCGAPLEGIEGTTVSCEYCGSRQVLRAREQ